MSEQQYNRSSESCLLLFSSRLVGGFKFILTQWFPFSQAYSGQIRRETPQKTSKLKKLIGRVAKHFYPSPVAVTQPLDYPT